jgi:uncharacterized protein (TIGR03067 family)
MKANVMLGVGAAVMLVPFGYSGSPKTDDAKSIQGTWKVVSMAMEGRQLGAEDTKDAWFKISATEIIIGRGERNDLPPRKYSINAKKSPKQIDIVDIIYKTDKNKKNETEEKFVMPGIYELDKDTLKICWNGEGVPPPKLERPTEFKVVGKSSFVVLKRQK